MYATSSVWTGSLSSFGPISSSIWVDGGVWSRGHSSNAFDPTAMGPPIRSRGRLSCDFCQAWVKEDELVKGKCPNCLAPMLMLVSS